MNKELLEGMSKLNLTVTNHGILINLAKVSKRGAFKRIWKTYIKDTLEANNISIIVLDDEQENDRDVWGEDYNFSGNGGRRFIFGLDLTKNENTFIDIITNDIISDMFEEDYAKKLSTRLNVNLDKLIPICFKVVESKKCLIDKNCTILDTIIK